MDNMLSRQDGKTAKIVNYNKNTATTESNNLVTNAEPRNIQDGFETIINCRWCGSKIKNVYIPELKQGDNNAPFEIVYDYEPCEKCIAEWKDMVVILEITEKELYANCLPIDIIDDVKIYPTGRQIGITEQAAKLGIDKNAKNGMIFFMEQEMFVEIFDKEFKK